MTDQKPTFDQLPELVSRLHDKIVSLEETILRQASNTPDAEILPLEEAAKLLDLKPATIYGLVHARKIPFLKRAKKLYFRRSALIKWLESGRQLGRSKV